MSAILTSLFAGLSRRFAYWGALIATVCIAVWMLLRQGRLAAKADLAIRRADARVRTLQTSKDIRHDLQNTDRTDLERRADPLDARLTRGGCATIAIGLSPFVRPVRMC